MLRGDSFTYVQELLFAPLQREPVLLNIDLLYSSKSFHLMMAPNPGYFSLDMADWFTTSQSLVPDLSYDAPWWNEEWWGAHQNQLDWTNNMDAAIRADNVAFVVAHSKNFESTLKDPTTTVDKFIKHDSVNLVMHYVEDLNVFATHVHSMALAGSIKLLRLLVKQDISLNTSNIPLDDACCMKMGTTSSHQLKCSIP
jgi:hypothetical protein